MLFLNKFENYIHRFIAEMSLIPDGAEVIVAVSGGVDSMALVHILYALIPNQLTLLHFNHGTRKACASEEEMVASLALKLGVPLFIEKLKLNLSMNNFEAHARSLRQKKYHELIKVGYLVAQGHHLDDSFEWSMMQAMKQSGGKSALGIPVENGGIIRPLMCVSKAQILTYALNKKIQWMEDESNSELIHERNFMRKQIISNLKVRYPALIKHYVHRSNEQALLYGVHRLSLLQQQNPLKITHHPLGGFVLSSACLQLYRREMTAIIEKLSTNKRGKISVLIDQVLKALSNKEKVFYGPYFFTGGVRAIYFNNNLYLYHESHLEEWQKFDQKNVTTQIPFGFALAFFPFLKVEPCLYSKLIFPLLKKTCTHFKSSRIPYGFV